jgi:hypothetical protein
MNHPLSHLLHAALITALLVFVMMGLMKQSYVTALTRSLLGGSIALIYMILFDHRLPVYMNKI